MRHLISILLVLLASTGSGRAANDTKTVDKLTGSTTLDTPTDLHVMGINGLKMNGTVDITHPDATVIFENIRPSDVIASYLQLITINGEVAKEGSNCWVNIYLHGTMVMPGGNSHEALTVWREENFQGESRTYKTSNSAYKSLSTWNNSIRSLVLRRGHMATLATMPDGTGYSRVIIACDSDIVIPKLQAELYGRISFIRIFRYQWVNKKGYASGDETDNELLQTTWYYDWSAGSGTRTNREYTGMRHHEQGNQNDGDWSGAWQSWSVINGQDQKVPMVLGQNEPDNTSGQDEVYTPVTGASTRTDGSGNHLGSTEGLIDHAAEFLTSGMRIGTFATCNPNTSWVKSYVNECRKRNIRVDFVATHWYKGGQSPSAFINDLKALHDATGLPVWITEWNNGANWTSESGFTTDSQGWLNWGSDLATQRKNNAVWLKDVLKRLDECDFVERYALYNAVEDKRNVVNGHVLTAAGEVYRDSKPTFAYRTKACQYIPSWNYSTVTDLNAVFTTTGTGTRKVKTLTLTWTNNNYDLTDMAIVQERISGRWTPIDTVGITDDNSLSVKETLDDNSRIGLRTFRICNVDADGKRRYSNESSVFIGGATAYGDILCGRIQGNNSDIATISFAAQPAPPIIFTGMVTNKNSSNGVVNHVVTLGKDNFTFYYDPWTLGGTLTISGTETTDFIALQPGQYQWSEMRAEVDTCRYINAKGALSKMSQGDTIEVTFNQPFDTTPIVIVQNVSTEKNLPTSPLVFDITPTGFHMRLTTQSAATKTPRMQYSYYLAITPGQATILGTGMKIYAGTTDNPTGGSVGVANYFVDTQGDTLLFHNPYIVADAQTHRLNAPSIMRQASTITRSVTTEDDETETLTYGVRVRRQVDPTAAVPTGQNTASKTGDTIGWIVVDSDNESVGIADIPYSTSSPQGPAYTVSNRRIYTTDQQTSIHHISGQGIEPGTPVAPGIYILSSHGKSVKIFVK